MKTNPTPVAFPPNRVNPRIATFSAILLMYSCLAGTQSAAAGLVNGSFESGYSGWTASGNQSIAASAPYVATQGSKLVAFNNGNAAPNGVLSQSFATVPGSSYTVRFDMGILAYNANEQRLQVDLAGSAAISSQTFSITRLGSTILRWLPQSVSFTANSTVTTLTFRDRSATSVSLDLLLDNVRVDAPVPQILTVDTGVSSVPVSVAPPDQNGAGDGISSFTRSYDPGKVVSLTAPASVTAYLPYKGYAYTLRFKKWLRNGASHDDNRATSVTMNGNQLMTTVFEPGPPIITEQPVSVTAVAGTSVTFHVGVYSPDTGYRWRLNGVEIPGVYSSTYTIDNVQASDAGTYDAMVFDLGGTTFSEPATLTVVNGGLVNGSFESGYDGWAVAGNQEIQSVAPYVATDGVKLVSFNSANALPNGVLSQTFATVPGMIYQTTFDMGILAYNRNELRLRVAADGNFNLMDREFVIKSINGETLRWVSQSLSFTADSAATTLSFIDRSATSTSLDLLLDHVRVIPDPLGFASIPAGTFQMGESPGRTVQVDAFRMAKYEVTQDLWNGLWPWAGTHGYTDLPTRDGKGGTHPVQTVTWFDAVKWCNARSEKEGLTPCYTVSGAVLRTGYLAPVCNWAANGYRLPTEAEWEKAARGGLADKRFPWGDTISHSQANYVSSAFFDYDVSPTRGSHPVFGTGSPPYTAPVGSFVPNRYGLYDTSGNIFEWCWDFWADSYDASQTVNPKGPATGEVRVLRGGDWGDSSYYCQNAARSGTGPNNLHHTLGFRLARSGAP